MNIKYKVKKGDRVAILSGKDKGKTGEILKMIPDRQRAVVQGVNMVKRHTAPSQAGAGGSQRTQKTLFCRLGSEFHPGGGAPPPPPLVLTGHVSSLLPY